MGELNQKLLIEQTWFQVFLVALVLALAYVLYRYLKGRRLNVSELPKEVSIEEKIALASNELEALEGLDLISKLDESLRLYIEYKCKKNVFGLTYEEILNSDILNQFSNENSEKIRSFYKFSEKSKYASEELTSDEVQTYKLFIKKLIDSVKVSEEVK